MRDRTFRYCQVSLNTWESGAYGLSSVFVSGSVEYAARLIKGPPCCSDAQVRCSAAYGVFWKSKEVQEHFTGYIRLSGPRLLKGRSIWLDCEIEQLFGGIGFTLLFQCGEKIGWIRTLPNVSSISALSTLVATFTVNRTHTSPWLTYTKVSWTGGLELEPQRGERWALSVELWALSIEQWALSIELRTIHSALCTLHSKSEESQKISYSSRYWLLKVNKLALIYDFIRSPCDYKGQRRRG